MLLVRFCHAKAETVCLELKKTVAEFG